jgi:LPS export ABC transporter protein LptC
MITSFRLARLRAGLLCVGLGLSLAGCKQNKTAPLKTTGSSLASTADQIMFGVRFNLTSAGVSTAYLTADTAFFFDDNTRAELVHVNMTFYTKVGVKDAVLTSRRGTYSTSSGVMIARGDVNVVSEDGRNLRSEELKFDQGRNEVSSDSAFVLTEPERRVEGIGFRSDPNLRNIRILKVLSGTSGTMTIPNQ